jgi:hypothetical protein
MAFVQMMEARTSKFEEIMALEQEWLDATEGRRTLRRTVVGRDREDPKRYVILAFFDSFESAMENSNLPETSEFGRKQGALLDAPMTFVNLDIIDDASF